MIAELRESEEKHVKGEEFVEEFESEREEVRL